MFLPCVSFSQVQHILANEIVLEENGIHPVSRTALDTIVMDMNNNSVLYRFADTSTSFWHKIYANADCEITFDIHSSGAEDRKSVV